MTLVKEATVSLDIIIAASESAGIMCLDACECTGNCWDNL